MGRASPFVPDGDVEDVNGNTNECGACATEEPGRTCPTDEGDGIDDREKNAGGGVDNAKGDNDEGKVIGDGGVHGEVNDGGPNSGKGGVIEDEDGGGVVARAVAPDVEAGRWPPASVSSGGSVPASNKAA